MILPKKEGSARLLGGALLVALALAAYRNSFSVPFLFDDHEAIAANPTIKNLWAIRDVLHPPSHGSGVTGRPVVNLTLAMNYACGGTNVAVYHWFNFALHALAGLVLFGLIARTLRQPALAARVGPTALPVAWCAAALWVVHPLHTESVTCVIQRTEVLVGFFYLLTHYCFIRACDSNRSTVWLTAAIAACAFGMGSKEVMVSAPLMVLLYDRTFVAGSFADAWRRRSAFYIGLAATWILLAYLVSNGGGTRGTSAGFGLGVSPLAYATKQCDAIVRYVMLAAWPHPLVLDYGESLAVPFPTVWLEAGALLSAAVATAGGLWRRPTIGFLGVWFFAILAPSSSVVPLLTQTVAEHRMYLPLIALIVPAVAVVHLRLPGPAAAVSLAVTAAFAVLTGWRNHDYRTGIAIWSDTALKSPRNSRAHHNLGVELAAAGHPEAAIRSFEKAIDCKPTDLLAHYSLAHELAKFPGRREQAIAHYETALQIDPRHANSHVNLAALLAADPARQHAAIAHYEFALRLAPDNSVAHNNLANELARLPGRQAEAAVHYEQALRLNPTDAEFHFNYAGLLATDERSASAARSHYERALALRPDFAEAHFRLANELAKTPTGLAEAAIHYETVLKLNPRHAQAHYNLGVVLANLRHTTEAIGHFEAVLELDPHSSDARENLALLKHRLPNP